MNGLEQIDPRSTRSWGEVGEASFGGGGLWERLVRARVIILRKLRILFVSYTPWARGPENFVALFCSPMPRSIRFKDQLIDTADLFDAESDKQLLERVGAISDNVEALVFSVKRIVPWTRGWSLGPRGSDSRRAGLPSSIRPMSRGRCLGFPEKLQ